MSLWKRVMAALGIGLLGGLLVASFAPGDFWVGFCGAAILTALSAFGLIMAWQWAGGGRTLAWMVALAFALRLIAGVVFAAGLPVWGFDTPQQKSGYLFTDAYKRDLQARELGVHGESLMVAFEQGFFADQYGGMLGLSAAVYRYFSPDTHRPTMVLIPGAFMAALGVLFLYLAVRLRWDQRLATAAGWLMALYPDSILFGASQMREPYLMGMMAITFWAILIWKDQRRMASIVIAVCLAVMALFSSLLAITLLIMFTVIFWFEYIAPISNLWKRVGQVGAALATLVCLLFFWRWLSSAATWDILVTQMGSGWIAKIIEEAGMRFRLPIITVYGLLQPVLPAAVADFDTRPVWYIIAVLRATGWYLLAPVLLYGIFALWINRNVKEQGLLVWISIFVIIWCLIAAVRAGGDQWDNPRYRVIFIPWLALLAAWAVDWAWKKRDAWLVRWILVEFIFLFYFTRWYIARYLHLEGKMYFWENVAWVSGLSLLVLASGWIWDFGRRSWKKKQI